LHSRRLSQQQLLLQYPRAIGGGGIQNNYSATFLRESGNVFNRGMIGMAKSFNEYKLLKIPAERSIAGEASASKREKTAKTSIINKLCAAQARKSYLKVGDFFFSSGLETTDIFHSACS